MLVHLSLRLNTAPCPLLAFVMSGLWVSISCYVNNDRTMCPLTGPVELGRRQ